MLETVTNPLNLKFLEQLLQQQVRSTFLVDSLQVTCLAKEATLVIMVESVGSLNLEQEQIFQVLTQTLETEKVSGEVLFYLIIENHNDSQLIEQVTKVFNPENHQQKILPVTEDHEKLLTPEPEKTQLNKFPLIAAITGISFITLLIIIYFVTRPCVIGKCLAIEQANQLAEESFKTLNLDISNSEIVSIKTNLQESLTILNSIPSWSSYHQQAQDLEKNYQDDLASLDLLIQGNDFAIQAKTINQNTPLSVVEWTAIQQLYQQAIATLEIIDSGSQFKILAQKKISKYEVSLAIVNQRLEDQKKALVSLKSAQEIASIASAREMVAQSLANWQQVEATWQTVVKRLQEIAPETTVYLQGQELLKIYIPKLVAAKNRIKEEESAIKIYNLAIKESHLANESQKIQQWSQALFYWQNALKYIKQISPKTFQYKQASGLLNSYNKYLEQAQLKLALAIKLQNLSNSLKKICDQTTEICNYIINDNGIKVYLTVNYMQNIFQEATEAKLQGNMQTQMELLAQISTLEQQLENMTNQAGIPVEVYNSEGNLITKYTPKN